MLRREWWNFCHIWKLSVVIFGNCRLFIIYGNHELKVADMKNEDALFREATLGIDSLSWHSDFFCYCYGPENREKILGYLILTSEGKEVLNDRHCSFVELLKEPLLISMSNALKHREVVKLNDLLADETVTFTVNCDACQGTKWSVHDSASGIQHKMIESCCWTPLNWAICRCGHMFRNNPKLRICLNG